MSEDCVYAPGVQKLRQVLPRTPYRVRMNLYSIDLRYIYRYFATHAMRE